ncbi:hypothetical protein BJV78DRAFT_795860 [Lactifluus subvellereus]|nr:hypothetical protein BJV78DRAFT_795860 [Lactifluus subvellereus]
MGRCELFCFLTYLLATLQISQKGEKVMHNLLIQSRPAHYTSASNVRDNGGLIARSETRIEATKTKPEKFLPIPLCAVTITVVTLTQNTLQGEKRLSSKHSPTTRSPNGIDLPQSPSIPSCRVHILPIDVDCHLERTFRP